MIATAKPEKPATLQAWASALGGSLEGADPAAVVTGVADDSRAVEAGHLFVARPGATSSGLPYVREAIGRGAIAVVSDADLPPDLPSLRVPDAGVALRLTADLWYGHPQEALVLVGITGTKGKTTTAWLVASALRYAGKGTAVFGTIAHDIGDRILRPARNTTPGLLELRRMLAQARDAGCTHAVMEVSSHALAQGRAAGLSFAAAVFTNLGRDHLDYHGDVDAYFRTKGLLFSALAPQATAVLNRDDERWWELAQLTKGRVLTYGTAPEADLHLGGIELSPEGTRFRLTVAGEGELDVSTPLVGRHNARNFAAAVGAAKALGIDPIHAVRGASEVTGVPGRLERIAATVDLNAYVDYAHTEEALREVLTFLGEVSGGDLVCVVGCGGDRDVSKRPRMAAAAVELSDRVYLTSDNPRTEDPRAILRDMEKGVPADRAERVEVVPDRAEAIRRAVFEAPTGACVLVAGKGHEDYQILGTKKIPFEDARELRRALAGRRRILEGEEPRELSRTR